MNQEFAIESFISFCDDMMIAEEGFKDKIKSVGKTAWQGLLNAIKKLLEKIRNFRNNLRMNNNKNIKIEDNWYDKFLSIEHFINNKAPSSIHDTNVDEWKIVLKK